MRERLGLTDSLGPFLFNSIINDIKFRHLSILKTNAISYNKTNSISFLIPEIKGMEI